MSFESLQRDCPGGQLSRSKFLEVYSEFFPNGNAEGFCEHVFRTFDTDNGGTIDFKEFLLAINITSSGKVSDKLEWAFSMYDIDGNGSIEKSEMVQIIKVCHSSIKRYFVSVFCDRVRMTRRTAKSASQSITSYSYAYNTIIQNKIKFNNWKLLLQHSKILYRPRAT